MADSKITALTSISTSTDPANDPLVIVDVSDTSMAATGTTKKVTLNQLLGASGTATLASATITGDLTVDTSTLKVDSANNRVGVNTASPTVTLDVAGAARFVAAAAGPKLSIENAGGSTRFKSTDTSSFYYSAYDHSFTNTDGSVNRYTIDNNGVSTWYVSGSTAMTLNSTGLGIGASPSYKLDINGVARVNSGGDGIFLSSASSPDLYVVGVNYYNNNGTEGVQTSARPSWKIEHKNSSDALAYLDIGFRAASAAASAFTSRFKIDGSGNVGIGITPKPWRSGARALQLGANGYASLHEQSSGAVNLCFAAYEGSANVFNYTTGDAASRYALINGQHQWYNAPSGTAGNAITFTQAMTLDASGDLYVGKTATGLGTVGIQESHSGWIQATVSGDSSIFTNRLASDGKTVQLYRQTLEVGNISVTTTGATFNSTSDYRLKEAVTPLSGGLARVNALKPSVYKWKSNGLSGEGFLAHELAEVVPAAVNGEKDAVNEDGSINAQSIDMSRVVPIIVAAIQELAAEVNALKNA